MDLLDMLQEHLPDKTGKKGKWNFEKAHSILHKVSEIVLLGNSDNTDLLSSSRGIYFAQTGAYFVVSMLWLATSRHMRTSSRKSLSILALCLWQTISIK